MDLILRGPSGNLISEGLKSHHAGRVIAGRKKSKHHYGPPVSTMEIFHVHVCVTLTIQYHQWVCIRYIL